MQQNIRIMYKYQNIHQKIVHAITYNLTDNSTYTVKCVHFIRLTNGAENWYQFSLFFHQKTPQQSWYDHLGRTAGVTPPWSTLGFSTPTSPRCPGPVGCWSSWLSQSRG